MHLSRSLSHLNSWFLQWPKIIHHVLNFTLKIMVLNLFKERKYDAYQISYQTKAYLEVDQMLVTFKTLSSFVAPKFRMPVTCLQYLKWGKSLKFEVRICTVSAVVPLIRCRVRHGVAMRTRSAPESTLHLGC